MMKWIFLSIALCAVIAFIVDRLRLRKTLKALEDMLDAALKGNFTVRKHNESQLSKLEFKFARYLDAARLKKGDLEKDHALIHNLISDISHQTKTPIANIQLYSQLLGEQPELSEQSQQLCEQLSKNTDKLSFLIQSLIKTSRLESGILQVKAEQSPLLPLLQEVAAQCATKAKAKGVALSLPEDSAVCGKVDKKWGAEAIMNILDNAIKYTPPGGLIAMNLHDYEMFARIQIIDNGCGMSEADLPKIFERFYRGSNAINQEGVGIGLYLARQIVQQCGGYIHVSSKPGMGSTFSIYLSKL